MILCLMRWRINLLSMGDEEARSLEFIRKEIGFWLFWRVHLLRLHV